MKKILLNKGLHAKVDDQDYEELSKYKWQLRESRGGRYVSRYIQKNNKRTQIDMHRVIAECPKRLVVDHIDGDGLNNQRDNLRVCTQRENIANRKLASNNTTGYKGVSKVKGSRYYHAYFKMWQGKKKIQMFLGSFLTKEAAARKYNEYAKFHFGEYANLNRVDEPEDKQVSLARVVEILEGMKIPDVNNDSFIPTTHNMALSEAIKQITSEEI